jgi:hypothetical protein
LEEVRKYPKYSCENQSGCGIVAAERPTGLVEGDKYDTSIAAEIIANKYAYHLPAHRQQDLFAGSGWTPSRGTLLNILKRCDWLVQYSKQVLQRDAIVACDDTGTTLLYPREPPAFDVGDPKQRRIAGVFADQPAKSAILGPSRLGQFA